MRNKKRKVPVRGILCHIDSYGVSGRSFPLAQAEVFFGSDKDCDIILKLDIVDKKQAILEVKEHGIFIRNCGGKFLTYVDQNIVKETMKVPDGAMIGIAGTLFSIRYSNLHGSDSYMYHDEAETSDVEDKKDKHEEYHAEETDYTFSDNVNDTADMYHPDSVEGSGNEDAMSDDMYHPDSVEGSGNEDAMSDDMYHPDSVEGSGNEDAMSDDMYHPDSVEGSGNEDAMSDDMYHPDSVEESGNEDAISDDMYHPDSVEGSGNEDAMSDIIPLQSGVNVQQTEKELGKRKEKKHCCFFCSKMYSKMARHNEQKHSNEKEVAMILCFAKKSTQRKNAWMDLHKRGNHKHNYEVIEIKAGEIIPKYRARPGEEKCYIRYIPCEFCLGSYVAKDLWKHQLRCKRTFKEGGNRAKGKPIRNGRLLLPTVGGSKGFYSKVLTNMREDSVKQALQKDRLIRSFADRLFEKHGRHAHQYHYISQRLRELARLLLCIKKHHPDILELSQSLIPANWTRLLSAVREVSQYSEESQTYGIPSLPLKLGHSLSKCAKLLRSKSIMAGDNDLKTNTDAFLDLYESEWTERSSAHAHTTLNELRFNKPLLIPLATDVKLLNTHLQKKAMTLKKSLSDTSEEYSDFFAEVCLAETILFNRRRSGEAQRITLNDFHALKEKAAPTDPDILSCLSKFEVELCKTHQRIEIRGKKGRNVAVLFTESMVRNIDILLEHRQNLGIESQYLFIKPGAVHPIRGCDTLRKFAKESSAKFPNLLTSTKLRKQLATMAQVLRLSSESEDMLAQFMGHDIRVHRQFYRLPEDTIEMAKVSKILHLINNGNIHRYKGKDFDEIQMTEKETLTDESDSDSDVDEHIDSQSGPVESESVKQKTKKKAIQRTFSPQKWTRAEKEAVERALTTFIKTGNIPGKRACEGTRKANKVLQGRTWVQIKNFIRNKLKSNAKNGL